MLVINLLLAIVILVVATKRWHRLGLSFTSPAGLLALVWGLIWLVHLTDLFGYFELSVSAQWLSLLPVLFMFVGEQLALGRAPVPPRGTHGEASLWLWFRLNAWIALAFAGAGLAAVMWLFGNPMEAGVGEQIKSARVIVGVSALSDGPLGFVAQYSAIARAFLFLGFISLVVMWLRDRPKAVKLGVMIVAITVVSDLSRGSRATILDFAFFVFAAAALTPRGNRRSSSFRLRWAAAMLVLLLSLGWLADSITRSTRPDRNADLAGVEVPLSVYQLGQYYSSTLVTFDQTLESTTYRTHGLMTGGGALALMSIFRVYRNPDLEIYEIMREWEEENPHFRAESYLDRGNLYSWLRYLYVDFGILGICLVPLVLGFAGGRRARAVAAHGGSVADQMFLAVAFYIVARSPLVFVVRDETLLLAILFAWALHRITLRRRSAGPMRQNGTMRARLNQVDDVSP